jgi:hypothetical protein
VVAAVEIIIQAVPDQAAQVAAEMVETLKEITEQLDQTALAAAEAELVITTAHNLVLMVEMVKLF